MTETVYISNHWTTGWSFTTTTTTKPSHDGYHHTTWFYLEPYRNMNKRLFLVTQKTKIRNMNPKLKPQWVAPVTFC